MNEKEEAGKSQDGFYRHKDTGVVVELVNDPALGSPLTNSYIRAGFEFVGKSKPESKPTEVELLRAELAQLKAQPTAELKEDSAKAEVKKESK
jgi:hypothetical protein